MDLFYGVNKSHNVITFYDGFAHYVGRLARDTDALQAELKASDRYKRGAAKFGIENATT